jgi:ketosteroid isomerase-like protein
MLETIFAALTQMMQAVNAGDAARYARLYAEDAVITIHGGGALQGRAAIEKYEVELLREFPGTRLAFYDLWQQGPVAVVHYGVNGKTAGGQAMGHEGLLFYHFAPGGLIKEELRYLDSLTPMAQLGALGPGPVRALPALPAQMKSHAAQGSPEEAANVALVRAAFAALDAKKPAEFLAKIAADAVVDEMIEAQPSSGRAGVTGWYERWTSAVPDARTEIHTILGAGDAVLVEAVVRGTLKGALGRLQAADKPFQAHRAAIVEVRGGRIVRLTAFMNGKELAQAVGQWPPRPAH